jgi:hypothetical protein
MAGETGRAALPLGQAATEATPCGMIGGKPKPDGGPDGLGCISPQGRGNAFFAAGRPPHGSFAFFFHSGALCTAIVDWA